MPSLWIVHRQRPMRLAIARLAEAPHDAIAGAPADPLFDAAETPAVVLLGLEGDLEAELEFAHRMLPRLHRSGWVLLGEPAGLDQAARLFDGLPATFVAWPPERAALRRAIREADRRGAVLPLPLSQRAARDALSQRFARCFADLELPGLLRALDPRMGEVPILILGEPGSGRATLARYLHQFGAGAGGALVSLPCNGETTLSALLGGLALAGRDPRCRRACTVWLEDVEKLPPALARAVSGWVTYGPPEGSLATARLRWIGSGRETGLDPSLRRALGGLTLEIPPLRERPERVASFADATARAWCSARGLKPRRLAEDALAALEEYPWPGNLGELEALIAQSLAASEADPLGPEHLVLDGAPFAPLEAGVVGALVEEPPASSPAWPPEPEDEPVRLESVLEEADLEEDLAAVLPEPPAPRARPAPPAAPPAPPPEAEAEPEPAAAPAETPPEAAGLELRRLADALSHELRNPLTAVRTFAELLPERHDDPEFRNRFGWLAEENLARVEEVLGRLERVARFAAPERRSVDVGGLLEEVLERRRGRIHERRILMLEELDRSRPHALCDPAQLRFALEGLLEKAVELVPERGHLYLASRSHKTATRASVRILLRLRGPGDAPASAHPQLAPAAHALDFAIAELLVRAQGGSLTLDTSDPGETVVIIDLPS